MRIIPLGQKAASAFTPASIAGLVGWFDAAQLTGYADGAAISSWTDLSGNGNHAVQATGALQPFYKAVAVNGLPAVRNGQGGIINYLVSPLSVSQPNSIAIMAQQTSSAGEQRIIDTGSASRQLLDYNHSGPEFIMLAGSVQGGGTPSVALHQMTAVFNGASSVLRVDGSAITLGGSPGSNGLTSPGIGGSSMASWFVGYICEVAFYSAALTGPQIASLESYLVGKWG